MRNTRALNASDLDGLKKLQDVSLAQYLLRIALASESIAHLKTERAIHTIQRAWLLALIHKTLMGTIVQRRQLEAECANVKTSLGTSMQIALESGDYAQLVALGRRMRITQKDHERKLAKLEDGLRREAKILNLTHLTERIALLTESLRQQDQQVITDTMALARIQEEAAAYIQADIAAQQRKAQPKQPIIKIVPSVYLPRPKTVDEKAQAVAKTASANAIQAYLTAVYRGELDKVVELLKANPQLVHAQGNLTDLSNRTFMRITGFQYAVWGLDGPMWDVILKHLLPADAKAQIEAYAARKDLIQQHGLQYSFDHLLKQYDIFIQNYQSWSWDRLSAHLTKKIAPEQEKMPSWMRYAFTEPGRDVAWVNWDVEHRYRRVSSKYFQEFQRVIAAGKCFLRFNFPEVAHVFVAPQVAGEAIEYDSGMMTHFKTQSFAQYQELLNDLTKNTAVNACTTTSNRPRP